MKKYLLVSLTLLFAAAFLWAGDVTNTKAEEEPAIEGSATLSWGIDLGSGTGNTDERKVMHGFRNEAEWKVTFPLLKKGDAPSKTPEGAQVYAEVQIKDIELGFESKHDAKDFKTTGKVGGISGKLMFYGAYLIVYNKPNFTTNYADLWKPLNGGDEEFQFKPGFSGYGTKIGYKNADIFGLDVGLKLGSNGDWEGKYPDKKDTDPLLHSKYGIGLDFSMKPLDKMLEFGLGVNATFDKAKHYKDTAGRKAAEDKNVIGFGAEVKSEPIDHLKFKLGFDGGMSFVTKNMKDAKPVNVFAWDMLFSASYRWISSGIYVAGAGTPFAGFDLTTTDPAKKETADMGVFLKFETKGEKETDGNYLVKGLDASAALGMYSLLSKYRKDDKKQLPVFVKLHAAYKAMINDSMWIKPFATFWGETNHWENKTSTAVTNPYFGIAYALGVEYQPLEKVTLKAEWTHGITKDKRYGGGWTQVKDTNEILYVITDPVQHKNHNGRFILSLKVSY